MCLYISNSHLPLVGVIPVAILCSEIAAAERLRFVVQTSSFFKLNTMRRVCVCVCVREKEKEREREREREMYMFKAMLGWCWASLVMFWIFSTIL